MAAGFAELAGPPIQELAGTSVAANIAGRAVVGAVGSKLGGGSYENGAVTAAFGYLFNHCAHGDCTSFGEQFAYDYMPGYKGGTGLYNSFTGGSFEFWEGVDLVSSVVGAAGKAVAVSSEALGFSSTLHGAERVGAAATRAGSLGRLELLATRVLGSSTVQADGARVFYRAMPGDRYHFAVYGENGLITSGNWSAKSVERIASRYGWKGFP